MMSQDSSGAESSRRHPADGGDGAGSLPDLPRPGADEIGRTLRALQVQQVELRAQNAELRRTHRELDAALARYCELFDGAPVGYCTIGAKGLIMEANLTAATMLGVPRQALLGQPLTGFILPEDQDAYYGNVRLRLEAPPDSIGPVPEPHSCELRLLGPAGTSFWAQLDFTVVLATDGAPVVRIAVSNIDMRRQAAAVLHRHAAELQARNETLDLFNRAAVGRELRMIELKHEVNELCRASGQPERYPIASATRPPVPAPAPPDRDSVSGAAP